ncbi:synaptopodin [Clupea harengus]|uniref:Synaptopodin n=1 Tax=Clupea harengus TaxID=7950 RepID=A0A6P8EN90_CLUHA|nr:synaptopodin [Clupea harengus]
METRGHEPVRRGVSLPGGGPGPDQSPGSGPGSLSSRGVRQGTELAGQAGTSPTADSWKKDKHSWVKGKPAVTSADSQLGRKTNLSRSASLSEKELKEARSRSQIIAAQLSVPSNSRGVQLFNRRRQRVNAFTLVSFGEGGGGGGDGEGEGEGEEEGRGEEEESKSEHFGTSPRSSELTWENKQTAENKDRDLNHRNSEAKLPWSSCALQSRGNSIMEDQGEAVHDVEDVDNSVQERHFLPVKEKEEEEEESADVLREEVTVKDDNNSAAQPSAGQREGKVNGAYAGASVETPGEISNGCHDSPSKPLTSVAKQSSSTIVNRTARPFFSPSTVQISPGSSPAMDIPPAPSYSMPPLPAFPEPPTPTYAVDPALHAFSEPPRSGPLKPAFSPPPPAPSYPTPPLPSYSSPIPPATMPGPSPRPQPAHYIPRTAPKPTYIPQMLTERRPQTPIRSGILDEGAARRGTRKSMFTFQEKPKVSPNPDLLSLVQGVDEKKKQRPLPENVHEEELLALGAEASNFLASEERVVEDMAPAWSSCLKSSRTAARVEHKPEQALTNVSGKGAELFAKRQSRVEKYVLENARRDGQIRSPSPTMSLPPSWVFPSNMPGRVKAIATASNVSTQISKTLKAQQATQKNNLPARAPAPAPAPAPPSPVLENGCTKMEMELSKHQPYQLNSSLFILNPTKDPLSSLPRGAPPPKPVVMGQSYARQTSLPTHVPSQFSAPVNYRPACFSPPLPLSPREVTLPVMTFAPERVASPRSAVGQAPRPTFSARKAGIEAQTKKETPAMPTASRTPTLTRRFSSPEGPANLVWSPSPSTTSAPSPRPVHRAMTTSPVSPLWETRCQSPIISQDTKANHRLLAKNIINAAKRKNSPSPGALSGHGLPISPPGGGSGGGILSYEHKPLSPFQPRSLGSQSPTFTSPPPTPTRMIRSPVRLYNTRSLTDSDASVESEDSGMRSPGVRTYNTCPRGWGGSLRIKRGSVHADL